MNLLCLIRLGDHAPSPESARDLPHTASPVAEYRHGCKRRMAGTTTLGVPVPARSRWPTIEANCTACFFFMGTFRALSDSSSSNGTHASGHSCCSGSSSARPTCMHAGPYQHSGCGTMRLSPRPSPCLRRIVCGSNQAAELYRASAPGQRFSVSWK